MFMDQSNVGNLSFRFSFQVMLGSVKLTVKPDELLRE